MPPVSPQGSRSGLVAAVVAFTILFVAATIFAIYFGVQNNQSEEKLRTQAARYSMLTADADNPEIDILHTQAQSDPKLAGTSQTALDELLRQRDDMRRVLVGSGGSIPGNDATKMLGTLLATAQTALADANKDLPGGGQKINDADNLAQAVQALSSEITALHENLTLAIANRDRALADKAANEQATQAAMDTLQQTIDNLKKNVASIDSDKQQMIAKAQSDLDAMKKSFDQESQNAAQAAQQAETQRIELTAKIDTLNKLVDQLRDKLGSNRLGVEEPVVRRHEGEIVRLADAQTVYIDLGKGDQVVSGMTFEVYDKSEPLPKLGDGMSVESMPVGKGSIEIVDVLDGTSKCYVTHLEAGEHFVEGDPILNIVYDPNTKYKFFVYGDFDFAQRQPTSSKIGGLNSGSPLAPLESRRPSPAARDLIKGLISQWGGQVQNHLGIDTDFVVMGVPPEVETFTPEELQDKLNQEAQANEIEAAKKYDEVIALAKDLHIPIMNQNRFLYFIGYYDLAPLAAK